MSQNVNHVSHLLKEILDENALYNYMQLQAIKLVKKYDEDGFVKQSMDVLNLN